MVTTTELSDSGSAMIRTKEQLRKIVIINSKAIEEKQVTGEATDDYANKRSIY